MINENCQGMSFNSATFTIENILSLLHNGSSAILIPSLMTEVLYSGEAGWCIQHRLIKR